MSKYPSARVTDNTLEHAFKMKEVEAARNIQAAHYLQPARRYQTPRNPIDSTLDLLALLSIAAVIIASLAAIIP